MLFCLGAPAVNPVSGKARQLPIVNPIDKHGRVFFLAWSSFLFSFLAWYAMPPLLNRTIRDDLNLTQTEVVISNIVALVAGLLTRLVAGPLCDRFGPRYVLVGILWAAAIPTGLAGTISGAGGLYVIRFFIGVCGGAFVPANIWVVSWFDDEVVGTATAFAAGWGDSGVGVTFFVMPAVFDSLISNQGLVASVAWRVSFIVPCVCLLFFSGLLLTLSDDTPNGAWSKRYVVPTIDNTACASDPFKSGNTRNSRRSSSRRSSTTSSIIAYIAPARRTSLTDDEANLTERPTSPTRTASLAPTLVNPPPQPPTFRENLKDVLCLQTLMLAALYFCTFGGGLALSSLLVSWYLEKFGWEQTKAGSWAAMFGLLNFVTRPSGGLFSDMLANRADDNQRVHVKKCEFIQPQSR
ncbi:MFS transporter, NNP family, nitrate/nitrite transporter, partial [Phenoliferia sp. Uapishka_3]